ncbi:hypothetical protein HX017_11865 [Myroides marinus]|uniref:Uncharacterized protein n=1 Tax=Myroides marinus TaxID=703342 RepID=A0A1H6SER7_9FLAO|nr:hypothetical protein [Myroides marinus]MDM1346377.1 hypothetical protein [Myroides marinus]MDM1351253.1 hypothetical protein [Myroides marinus]MDM1353977.1 hypothetical protein [Myroides marinus]MDM1358478.1 hypothetical protein [Myroides marinus]MDM1360504.1 hypothetical protein [Myroides marinus]
MMSKTKINIYTTLGLLLFIFPWVIAYLGFYGVIDFEGPSYEVPLEIIFLMLLFTLILIVFKISNTKTRVISEDWTTVFNGVFYFYLFIVSAMVVISIFDLIGRMS